ncbi:MAG: hypothetical protein RJS97_08700 [Parvibaculaceae bacterium]
MSYGTVTIGVSSFPQFDHGTRSTRDACATHGPDATLPPAENCVEVESALTRGSISLSDKPDWLLSRLLELQKLRSMPAIWESTEADPPNDTALQHAAEVLDRFAAVDLEPNRISPSIEEGVCLSCRDGMLYADIECFNTGEIMAAMSDGNHPTVVTVLDAAAIRDTVEQIAAFIRR